MKKIKVTVLAALVAMLSMTFTDWSYATSVTDTIDLSSPASTDYVTVETSGDATTITVTSDGTYEFTGSGSNETIVVAKKVTATLILNNASIDNSGYTNADPEDDDAVIESAINCKKNSVVNIQLTGTSTIKNNPSDSYMENAIKHGKEDDKTLTISGSGSLSISGTSDDAVKYNGGNINLEGGSVSVNNCLGDGVKCKLSSDVGGAFNMTDGTLTITNCYGDGVQAEEINISGGTTNITTTYATASTQYYTSGSSSISGKNTIWESGSTKYERVNVDTGSHKALKGGTKAKTSNYNDGTDSSTTSASGGITITGGTVNIDTTATGLKANSVSTSGYTATSTGVYIIGSPDDGVHSNNTFTMTDGVLNIAAADDGLTAAGELSITGPSVVNITNSYEGIEGATVNIGESTASSNPTVTIVSNDDGINSASKTLTYTYDSSDDEDANYLKASVSAQSGANTNINGGSVQINIDSANSHTTTLNNKTITYGASGDGIDCNGSLDIEGGTVYVFGQVSGDNSPIDTNDGYTLSNSATVLATGCDGMNESVPDSGSGVYITYTGSSPVTAATAGSGKLKIMAGPGGGGNQPGGGGSTQTVVTAGQTFTVTSGSTTLVSKTLPYAASFVMYASPDLTSGSSYTVSVGSSSGGESGGGSSGGSSGGSESGGESGGGSSGGSSSGGSSGGSGESESEETNADEEAAAAATATITSYLNSALSDGSITLDDETAVNAALAAYNALTEDQKALVDSALVEKLTSAQTTITQWHEYEDNVAAAQEATAKAKAKAKKGRKAVVSVTAADNVSYIVRYSTSKKFTKNVKTKKVAEGKSSVTLKSLKKGKTYYIQVRPVTEVTNEATGESVKVSGKWSSRVKVKVKK